MALARCATPTSASPRTCSFAWGKFSGVCPEYKIVNALVSEAEAFCDHYV